MSPQSPTGKKAPAKRAGATRGGGAAKASAKDSSATSRAREHSAANVAKIAGTVKLTRGSNNEQKGKRGRSAATQAAAGHPARSARRTETAAPVSASAAAVTSSTRGRPPRRDEATKVPVSRKPGSAKAANQKAASRPNTATVAVAKSASQARKPSSRAERAASLPAAGTIPATPGELPTRGSRSLVTPPAVPVERQQQLVLVYRPSEDPPPAQMQRVKAAVERQAHVHILRARPGMMQLSVPQVAKEEALRSLAEIDDDWDVHEEGTATMRGGMGS